MALKGNNFKCTDKFHGVERKTNFLNFKQCLKRTQQKVSINDKQQAASANELLVQTFDLIQKFVVTQLTFVVVARMKLNWITMSLIH